MHCFLHSRLDRLVISQEHKAKGDSLRKSEPSRLQVSQWQSRWRGKQCQRHLMLLSTLHLLWVRAFYHPTPLHLCSHALTLTTVMHRAHTHVPSYCVGAGGGEMGLPEHAWCSQGNVSPSNVHACCAI